MPLYTVHGDCTALWWARVGGWFERPQAVRVGQILSEAESLRVADGAVAGDRHVLLDGVLKVGEQLVVERHELGRVADQLALVARALVRVALGRELAILIETERREVRLRAGLPPLRERVVGDDPRVAVRRVGEQPVALCDDVVDQVGDAAERLAAGRRAEGFLELAAPLLAVPHLVTPALQRRRGGFVEAHPLALERRDAADLGGPRLVILSLADDGLLGVRERLHLVALAALLHHTEDCTSLLGEFRLRPRLPDPRTVLGLVGLWVEVLVAARVAEDACLVLLVDPEDLLQRDLESGGARGRERHIAAAAIEREHARRELRLELLGLREARLRPRALLVLAARLRGQPRALDDADGKRALAHRLARLDQRLAALLPPR
eukprot:5044273-Prymnesium_polylepis.1